MFESLDMVEIRKEVAEHQASLATGARCSAIEISECLGLMLEVIEFIKEENTMLQRQVNDLVKMGRMQ